MSAAGAADEAGAVFTELWRGLLLGSIASGLAALPAAWRAAHAGASFAGCWFALAGSTALLLAPAVGAYRAARPMPRAVPSVLVALLLAAGPLMIFARLLKTTTHHRPLGAATFAIVAAGVLLGCLAVSGRLVLATEQAQTAGRRRTARHLLLVLAAASSLIAIALAVPALHGGLRADVFDGALAVALAIAAALPHLSGRLPAPRARLVGPLLWFSLAAAGLAALHWAPGVRAACSARAPVLLGLPGWLG